MPPPIADGDSLEASVTEHVASSFRSAGCEMPTLLATDGELCFPPQCIAVPIAITSVWSSSEWDQILGVQSAPYLSRFVSDKARFNLKAWGWIKNVAPRDIVINLTNNEAIPRPRTVSDILTLWSFVNRVNFDARSHNWLREIHLVPVEAGDTLHRCDSVIRLGERKPDLPDSEWQFFSSFVRVIDRNFLTELQNAELMVSSRQAIDLRQANSLELLKDFELNTATPLNQIVNKVCEQVASGIDVCKNDLIRLAHIFAALDATVNQSFIYVNRKNGRVNLRYGMMADSGDRLDDVLPSDFCDRHTLHSDYESNLVACSLSQWQSWAVSPKSGLASTCILVNQKIPIFGRPALHEFLSSVGASGTIGFQYRTNSFSLDDWVIDPTVLSHLTKRHSEASEVWALLLTSLLNVPSDLVKHRLTASLSQIASTGKRASLATNPIPAAWIRELASKPCLHDIYGSPRIPADLLLRSPDTEPLQGIDSFVSADLDILQNRPLLKMLGARDTASGTKQIVDRIIALAKSDSPPLHALAKWYEALDRAAARAKPNEIDQLREVFSNYPLIWTNDQQWSRSAEVFCFADSEVMPEAPTIHESVDRLPLWNRIGVADRPSEAVVLGWLGALKVGEKLEVSTALRVKACLANFSTQVFDQLQCWISLDNHWLQATDFQYKLDSTNSFRVFDLFVNARRYTADLRDIRNQEAADRLFAALEDLPTAIRLVISKTVFDGDSRTPPAWMKALGETLQRIVLEDKELQERVRNLGKRVANTKLQIVETLQVTPYLNNEPVGQSVDHNALWQESVLFLKNRKIVEILDELVSELQRPFHLSAISDAIRVCVERTESFVIEYLDGKFDLEPVSTALLSQEFESKFRSDNELIPIVTAGCLDEESSGKRDAFAANNAPRHVGSLAGRDNTEIETEQSQDSFFDSDTISVDELSRPVAAATLVEETVCDDGAPLAGVSIVDHEPDSVGIQERAGIDEVGAEPSKHLLGDLDGNRQRSNSAESNKGSIQTGGSATDDNPGKAHEPTPTKPSLVERYLAAKGFVAVEDSFKNADGILLAKTAGLFTFEMRDATGQLVKHIWFKSQSLLDGLEVPAELWNLLKVNPERSVIVCEGFDGEPVELLGSLLLEELGHERVQLFTASYRLREIAPSRFSVR